jgi:hypothetical protein
LDFQNKGLQMTKVISFSLWGNDPRYTQGMVRNAELAKEVYPDWTVTLYAHQDVNQDILQVLENLDVQIRLMTTQNWKASMWRFYQADGPNTVIVRDADSRISYREKFAVDEWLASDKDFHIIRDHPYHAVPIMAGMWGARNGILKGITDQIERYEVDKFGVDQDFLKDVVFPKVVKESFVHDTFYGHNPIPIAQRHPDFFVGQAYDGADKILDADGNFQKYFEVEKINAGIR